MVRALAFQHACVLRIVDFESKVCSDMPNRIFQHNVFSQHLCPTRIKFHFMFIFLTLTSASYIHQNKISISLLCNRLFATCITNSLAAKPFWACYLWYLQSRWPSFYIVIGHRCSCYHKHNPTLFHKLFHFNWLCKHLIVIDCIISKREQHNNRGMLESIQSGCVCLD